MSSLTLEASSPLPPPLSPQPGPLWSLALHPSNTSLTIVGSSPTHGYRFHVYTFPDLSPLPTGDDDHDLGFDKRTLRCCIYDPTSSLTSTTLALGSFSGSIYILHSSSLSSFSLTQTLQGQESEIKSLSYTPSADILASSSRDKTLWLWDTQTYEPLSILSSHTGDIKSCLFLTPLKIASCGYDGLLKIWEEDEDGDWSQTQNLEPEKGEELGDDTLWCIGGMGSSYRIFVGNGKGEVIVYQDENGRYKEIGRIEGNNEECYEVNLPSVKAGHCGILRTGGMGFEVFREKSSFGQIDGEKFRKDCEVKYAHDGEVNCVKWCRGGERVVSVGDDGRVRVWKYDIG